MHVKFYFPSKDRMGTVLAEKLANAEFNNVVTKFCTFFGGATVSDGYGYYMSSGAGLIAESVRIISSYTDMVSGTVRDDILAIAEYTKKVLAQESIMVEFGDTAEFI